MEIGTGGDTIFNIAEITAVNQSDPDSAPNNHVGTEDDQDAVPIFVGVAVPPSPENINAQLALDNLVTSTSFAPVADGPAGLFTITATFINDSANEILDIFFLVAELTGDNLLLNAEGGPGGVGAVLSVPNTSLGGDGVLSPGESFTLEFLIGLAVLAPFDFLVNVFGTV